MNPESIIKGRIAEHIVELLLEDSGYKVIRIAQEGLLINVAREATQKLSHSDSAGKITTAPSFAVVDKKGKDVALVKVKFRGEKSKGGNIAHGIGQLQKYWPEAMLVVVSEKKPNFIAVSKTGNEKPIEESFPLIKKESLAGFEGLVEKFF